MSNNYKKIVIVHALDESTEFLSDIAKLEPQNYMIAEPEDEAISALMEQLKLLEQSSLLIFLGHGHSSGLYCSHAHICGRRTFVNVTVGDIIFKNHDVFLLSCNSIEFIGQLTTARSIIGFGNILSSRAEVDNEANIVGKRRDLSEEDIKRFNTYYVEAVIKALELVIQKRITFKSLPQWISYFINKNINLVLREKDKENRKEVARLLFDFRNEILCK